MRGPFVVCLCAVWALGQGYNPVAKERAPDTIQGLPVEVRQDLAKRQCLVPKYVGEVGPQDSAYTTGRFRTAASNDYAVVCHIPPRKVQNVLVYSNAEGDRKSTRLNSS